jgi:hypothetical protein
LNVVEEDMCLGLPKDPGSRRLQDYDRAHRTCRVEPSGFAYESQAQNRLMAFPLDIVPPRSRYKVYGEMALREFRSRMYAGPYGDALKSKVNSNLYSWMARMIIWDAEDCAKDGSVSRAVCDDLATLTKAELIPVFCAHRNYYMWGGLLSSPMTVFQKLIGLKPSSSECPAAVQ